MMWDPLIFPLDGGDLQIGYELYFADATKQDNQWTLACKTLNLYCEISQKKFKLIPYRTYKFKVIAYNSLGKGPESFLLFAVLPTKNQYSSSEGVTYLFFSFFMLLTTLC